MSPDNCRKWFGSECSCVEPDIEVSSTLSLVSESFVFSPKPPVSLSASIGEMLLFDWPLSGCFNIIYNAF